MNNLARKQLIAIINTVGIHHCKQQVPSVFTLYIHIYLQHSNRRKKKPHIAQCLALLNWTFSSLWAKISQCFRVLLNCKKKKQKLSWLLLVGSHSWSRLELNKKLRERDKKGLSSFCLIKAFLLISNELSDPWRLSRCPCGRLEKEKEWEDVDCKDHEKVILKF